MTHTHTHTHTSKASSLSLSHPHTQPTQLAYISVSWLASDNGLYKCFLTSRHVGSLCEALIIVQELCNLEWGRTNQNKKHTQNIWHIFKLTPLSFPFLFYVYVFKICVNELWVMIANDLAEKIRKRGKCLELSSHAKHFFIYTLSVP